MAKAAKKAAPAKAATEDTDAGFDQLSKIGWGHIQKEKMLPEGTYRLKIRGTKRIAPTDTKSGQLLVFLTPLAPMDDVDADAFAELGENYDVAVNSVKGQFWLSEARDFAQVDDLFEKVGIDTDELKEADADFDESLKMLKGREVCAYVKVDNYKDGAGNERQGLKATAFSAVED